MLGRQGTPAWPIRFSGGDVQLDYDDEIIAQAIETVIGTQIGERRVRRGFGSRIPALVFETDDDVLNTLADVYTREAIGRWVPGVSVLSVTARRVENKVELTIDYMITSKGKRGTSVVVLTAPEGVVHGQAKD